MKRAVFLAGMLMFCLSAGAQHKKTAAKHRRHSVIEAPAMPVIYKFVDQKAVFQGDVSSYFRDKLRYPEYARDNGMEGTAYVLFEISRDGSVRFISIRRSSGSSALDAEARRVVSGMPRWSPAKEQGMPIRALMILPVSFRLD